MVAGGTPLQFVISCAGPIFANISAVADSLSPRVDPESGRAVPGKCTFRLAMKVNGVEKELDEPTSRIVKMDPRQLEFVVL